MFLSVRYQGRPCFIIKTLRENGLESISWDDLHSKQSVVSAVYDSDLYASLNLNLLTIVKQRTFPSLLGVDLSWSIPIWTVNDPQVLDNGSDFVALTDAPALSGSVVDVTVSYDIALLDLGKIFGTGFMPDPPADESSQP